MTKIGFIGLGIMGNPMAMHLQNAGHSLCTVKHISPIPEQILGKGAVVYETPKDLAKESEVIITMVPDTPDVEEVLLGTDGVIAGLQQNTLVIDMSSISPIATQEIAKQIELAGGQFIDAPVSGGEVGAREAKLTIMCGAKGENFEKVLPLLELMGSNITLVGDIGAGQTCKVANQIIVALTIEAVSEALLFASKAGVDPKRVREALMGGFAGSRILEVHGERMIERGFDPGFRIRLHQKDLKLALEGARSLGIGLPNTATAQELFNVCTANGWQDLDHSAMVRALELFAAHQVAN